MSHAESISLELPACAAPQQSAVTFAPSRALADVRDAAGLLAALARHGIAHRESSKSICVTGTDAVGALSRDLLAYYAPCADRPLCLKLSRSQEFVGEHDVRYVWSDAATAPQRRAYHARMGTVRSKLAVGTRSACTRSRRGSSTPASSRSRPACASSPCSASGCGGDRDGPAILHSQSCT